jgi:hypothetical protein
MYQHNDAHLWATHKVECQDCKENYPTTAGGAKASLLNEGKEVPDKCPYCEKSCKVKLA